MVKKEKTRTPRKTKTENLQARVPEEYVFWCCDGRKFYDLKELIEGLHNMSDDTYAYHVNSEKNDFCNWVRDIIKDDKLAVDLAMATSRETSIQCVVGRLSYASGKRPRTMKK